jgi:hypothetical protein
MKLTQLTEQKERPYICVHAKKGKHETHAVSSYDAAKNAAKHWGMKSTAGIDAHLAEAKITEGPCDVATREDISKMNADEYAKYAQWKQECEAEERNTPLSTKRFESKDDMEYTVWVGGTEVNDNWLSYEEAKHLHDKYKAQGYDDVQLDARLKEGSFWGRNDMVKKMKDEEKASGMKKFIKIDDKGNHHGTTTSDPEQWKELIAKGYKEDTGYYEGTKPDFLDLDKDGDKKEPMKKAAKDKKAIKEGLDNDDTRNIAIRCVDEMVSQGLIPNDMDTDGDTEFQIQDIIHDQINKALSVSDKFESVKEGLDNDDTRNIAIRCVDEMVKEGLIANDMDTDGDTEFQIQDIIHDQINKALSVSDKFESVKEDEEAIAARDEFLKVMDMKPKSSNKAIDTIKKIVADKQNMQVKFDDGKMKVDLYTASAISQVYDAVKPETQEKIDNMLRTKEGMLKLSNFAFSKLSEGVKEGKRIDEILPALAIAARAVAPALGQVAKKVAGAAIKHPVKTAQVVKTIKSDKPAKDKVANIAKITQNEAVGEFAQPIYDLIDELGGSEDAHEIVLNDMVRYLGGDQIEDFVADFRRNHDMDEALEELQAPYTGKDGIKDKTGKMHNPNSPQGKMIKNMTKQNKPAPAGAVKPAGVVQKQSTLGKVAKGVGGLAKKIGNPITRGAQLSGFGNPLSASKQHANDMVEKAMKDAEKQAK